MTDYSTCRRCQGLLQVTNNCNVHPLCEPKPTRIEQLEHELQTIQDTDDTEALIDRLCAEIDKLDTQPPQMLRAALTYASWGWPVFPLVTGTKQPATPRGFKDATTDVDAINSWWYQRPQANIGLATGHKFDVIDLDLPDGPKTWAGLNPVYDIHGRVRTASGGLHLYVEVSPKSGNRARTLPGIDYRGIGGYVVAPPSLIDHGHRWEWTMHPSPVITGEKPLDGQ